MGVIIGGNGRKSFDMISAGFIVLYLAYVERSKLTTMLIVPECYR